MKTIKLLILIIATSFVISSSCTAQERYFGIQSGINVTNVNANITYSNTGFQTRLFFGINYEYLLKKRHSFEIGILYTEKGYRQRVIVADGIGTLRDKHTFSFYNYNYIGLPIKYGYRITGKLSLTGRIGIVPSISLKNQSKTPAYSYVNGLFVIYGYIESDISGSTNSFDLSSIVELEPAIKISPRFDLTGILAFQYSLTKVSREENFGEPTKLAHYGLQIGLGLKCRLGD